MKGKHIVRRPKKRIAVAVFFAFAFGASTVCCAPGSSFAKLDFGGTTYIEIPRSWTYLDENLRKHLSTAGEAVTRLAGITPNPGDNVILFAASAYTSSRTASATLRLSVRHGDSPTQAEMRELSNLPNTELARHLAPAVEETRRIVMGTAGVKSAKAVAARVAANQSLMCVFVEFEMELADGIKLTQTYLCPLGSRAIKLASTYRKSEAAMFRPVIEYAWQSLTAK